MIKLITAALAVFRIAGKFFINIFSAKAKAKRKAIKNGEKAIDDNDTSGVVSAFDKLR